MLATADTSTTENTHQEIKPSLKDSGQKIVEESKVPAATGSKKTKTPKLTLPKIFIEGID